MKKWKKLLLAALMSVLALALLTGCGIDKDELTDLVNEGLADKGITVVHDESLDRLIDTGYSRWMKLLDENDISGSKARIKAKFYGQDLNDLADELGIALSSDVNERKTVWDMHVYGAEDGAELILKKYDELGENGKKYTRMGIKVVNLGFQNLLLVVLTTDTAA